MAIWFQIALVLNLIYWTVFFYLVSRRRWTGLGLAVGIFHMFFASLVSVAPIRSILDPDMSLHVSFYRERDLGVEEHSNEWD